MKSFHALLCTEHNELIVADDTCESESPLEFLLKHRLCCCEIVPWCSSLDAEDNGFPDDTYRHFQTKDIL